MSPTICPICAVDTGSILSLVAAAGITQHRCAERTLRGIDAAMQVEEREPRTPSLNERLREGFAMMGDNE
jgi:hypothetical protein